MEPLLSITSPMLTGTSSRLKTESFCSALSSNTRKFSSLNPSTNFPRSSRTVVCRMTRLTSTLMLPPCELDWPGGGGCVCGREMGLSCAKEAGAKQSAKSTRDGMAVLAARVNWSVTRRVVAGLGEHIKGREPLGGAQLDLDFAPARVVRPVAWMVSQNILVTQLHANLGGDVREILEPFDGENAPAGHIGNVSQQRRPVQFFRGPIAISKRVENSDGIELSICFFYEPLDVAFVVPTMIIPSVG